MTELAEEDKLPAKLDYNGISNLSVSDFEHLFKRFSDETGLSIRGSMYLRPDGLHWELYITDERVPVSAILQ